MAQFFTDFEDQVVGTFPAGWTGRTASPAAWEVVNWHPNHGNAISTTVNSERQALTWDMVGEHADVEIYYECGSPVGSPTRDHRTALRLDTTKNTSSATAHMYAAGYSTGNTLTKYVNGSFTSVASGGDSPGGITDIGEVFAARVRINGSTIQIRTWDKSLVEPTTWGLEATDTSVSAAGALGLFGYSSNGWWSAFGVGTDGDAAPTSAVVAPATPTLSLPNATLITATSATPNVTITF